MKVLVYHHAKQHIYRLIEGLERNKINYLFYTGLYYTCLDRKFQKSFKFLKNKRFSPYINPKNVRCIDTAWEVFFSIWANLNFFMRERNRLLFQKQLLFQKKLLKIMPYDITHIITFHTNAFYLYEKLQKLEDERPLLILESAQPHPMWIKKLYLKYPKLKKYLPLNYTEKMIKTYSMEFELADIIVAPSTFLKNTLTQNKVNNKKIRVIFYGSYYLKNTPNNLKRERDKNRKLNIAFSGIISPSKGFHFLKEVAKRTEKFAEFHVFGRPISKGFIKDLPSNVHLYGFVSHKTLFNYYSFMDIFYFPTLYDASGLALLEGMGAGLVPVASPYSIGPDIIKNGVNGYIVNPDDIEKTVEILYKLHLNRDKLIEMSNKVEDDVKKFTWENYQNEYLKLLRG